MKWQDNIHRIYLTCMCLTIVSTAIVKLPIKSFSPRDKAGPKRVIIYWVIFQFEQVNSCWL